MDLAQLPDAVVYPQRIREVSHQAQKIHDDIHHGHLLTDAHNGHTTTAVGTYLHQGGKSVYLHGEDHLRQVADTFDSSAKALLAFESVHAAEMRPGPAPWTDTERAAIEARSGFGVTTARCDLPARSWRPSPSTWSMPTHDTKHNQPRDRQRHRFTPPRSSPGTAPAPAPRPSAYEAGPPSRPSRGDRDRTHYG